MSIRPSIHPQRLNRRVTRISWGPYLPGDVAQSGEHLLCKQGGQGFESPHLHHPVPYLRDAGITAVSDSPTPHSPPGSGPVTVAIRCLLAQLYTLAPQARTKSTELKLRWNLHTSPITSGSSWLNLRSNPKPKLKWDLHLLGAWNRIGCVGGVLPPFIEGRSGTAVSLPLSGRPDGLGSC